MSTLPMRSVVYGGAPERVDTRGSTIIITDSAHGLIWQKALVALGWKITGSVSMLDHPDGGSVRCISVHSHEDRLRGETATAVVFVTVPAHKPQVWSALASKAVADGGGHAMVEEGPGVYSFVRVGVVEEETDEPFDDGS